MQAFPEKIPRRSIVFADTTRPESVKLARKPETLKPTANATQIEHWNAVAGKEGEVSDGPL